MGFHLTSHGAPPATPQALVKQLGVLAGDIQKWQLLIDWEPWNDDDLLV
jgi:hypothetical protein